MKRFLFAAGAFALVGLSAATAEDPKPAQPAQPTQPKAVQVRPVQPQPLPAIRVAPATLTNYEENVELLEVQRDAKKAFIKAAEVAVRMRELDAERLIKAVAAGAGSKEDAERARLEVEGAKAQLEIRIAEMKEVEVRLKYARKRLEDAKASPGTPLKSPDPRPAVVTLRVTVLGGEDVREGRFYLVGDDRAAKTFEEVKDAVAARKSKEPGRRATRRLILGELVELGIGWAPSVEP